MGVFAFLKRNIKKEIILAIIILLLIVWSIFIYYLSPDEIVTRVGIKNSYLLVIILGFLGGTSILFPFPYYLFVLTFAAGGSNPILLGVFSGLGVILGETTSYYVGYQGRIIFSGKFQRKLNQLAKSGEKTKNAIGISLALFIYGACVPLPNDVLVIPFGVARYNYFKFIIPLGLGNIIFNIILAYSGIYGWNLFFIG